MPKALTEISVSKMKPGTARLEVPDGFVSGLYLVVQTSGKKSFAVRYRAGGAPRKLTLGAYPAMKLADARKAAKDILLDVAGGADPAAAKQAAKAEARNPAKTFETAVRRYVVEFQQRRGNRTWREPARQLGLVPPKAGRGAAQVDDVAQFVPVPGGMLARWGARQLDDISADEIIAELDAQAPVQANRVLATLRTFWKFAMSPRVKLATVNPVAGIDRTAPETSRDRVLTDEELRKVWWGAEVLDQPWTALTRILILSGQRRDEVAHLPSAELDIPAKKWQIAAERAKNGVAHLVHLSGPLLQELAALPMQGEFVFSRGSRPVGDFTDAKAKLDLASGVTGWTFHDLRRTMATRLGELGVASAVVEGLLNHKSGAAKAGVAGVYNRAELEPQRYRAINAWGRYVALVVDESDHGALLQRLREAADEYEARLEFGDAILAGGTRWESFLASLRGEQINVVSIREAM